MALTKTIMRKAAAEAIGTAFLLACAVGSGIMGERGTPAALSIATGEAQRTVPSHLHS